MVDDLIYGALMFGFLFGVLVGTGGAWFVSRFKDSLLAFKKKAEKKIEDTLKAP